MADFLQPDSDGALGPDMNEWRKGLVYTAKPEIPSPLRPGQEYRITVAFKRKTGTTEAFTGYGELYQRVTAIAKARISQLKCANTGEAPYTWLMCHGWRCLGDAQDIATAFITIGLVCPEQAGAYPKGENEPSAEALRSPGGATLEVLTRFAPQRADEFYNEFDFSHPSDESTDPVILSYGESVPTCEGINFQPFVQRAEKLASFYHDLLQTFAAVPGAEQLRIIRRKWYCVTHPNLVTIEVHFAVID